MNNSPFARSPESQPPIEAAVSTHVTKYNRVEDVPKVIVDFSDAINSAQQLVERKLLERTRGASNVKRHGFGLLSTTVIHDGQKLYLADRQADLAISVDPQHVGGIRFSAQLMGSTTEYHPGQSAHQFKGSKDQPASQAVTCIVQPARPGEPEFIQVDVLRIVNSRDAENLQPGGEQSALTADDLATISHLKGVMIRLASQYAGDFRVEPALLLTREAMDARSAGLPPTIVR